jgi:asparagine synthase (glutamine-hydrolysing)
MTAWPGASLLRARGGTVIACSGEIYWTDRELGELAGALGPAEALAAGYSRNGVGVLRHAHGAFAVVVFDPATHSAFAAIDRMGIRSMCYSANDEQIVGGGEAQQVAAHPSIGANIDPQGIYDYLFCHVVPAPRTIYRGVSKLLPAQCLLWRDGKLETGFSWELRYAPRARPTRDLEARFLELVERSVAHATMGCDRVAAFLSGGTDSSTVTGMLGKVRGAPPEAYSIGFKAEGFDEMEYARIAARHFGACHHPYYVTPTDVRDMIPRVAAAYDEPFGNASALPAYFCARRARDDGVERMLAGDGGDELFGGNARYAKQKVFEAYWRIPAPLRQRVIEPSLLAVASDTKIAPLRKLANYVRQARVPLPDRLETYNFLVREAPSALFTPEFLAVIDPDAPAAASREIYGRTASAAAVDRMMHLDLKLTLADNDLRKVNRMSELAGVQVR